MRVEGVCLVIFFRGAKGVWTVEQCLLACLPVCLSACPRAQKFRPRNNGFPLTRLANETELWAGRSDVVRRALGGRTAAAMRSTTRARPVLTQNVISHGTCLQDDIKAWLFVYGSSARRIVSLLHGRPALRAKHQTVVRRPVLVTLLPLSCPSEQTCDRKSAHVQRVYCSSTPDADQQSQYPQYPECYHASLPV